MVNMETPKCRKLRRMKGSSKKKKRTEEVRETRNEKCENAGTSANASPPQSSKSSIIIERGQEEVRGVVWQYHGKFVESDVPVVWGSPHGSPVVNPVQTACESPINSPKTRTANCIPRKLDSEESEPPQFFNELLALSEKIKADEKNSVQSPNNIINAEKELKASKSTLEESFSIFFDEDMNECMLQCSQELEDTSLENTGPSVPSNVGVNGHPQDIQNKNAALKTPILRTSPRKRMCVGATSKSSLNTSSGVFHLKTSVNETETKLPRVGNKNYVHTKHKGNTYVFRGRVLGSRGNSGAIGSEQGKVNSLLDKKNSLDSKLHTVQKLDRVSKVNRSCDVLLDNSFETVKESFLDDDIEFLSTIPDDLEMVTEIHNRESAKKVPFNSSETKQQICDQFQNTTSVLEDSTYFEDGILQYLDTIESNVTSSQPLRCTPEEIEKKRQEAKLKLQKKKLLSKK